MVIVIDEGGHGQPGDILGHGRLAPSGAREAEVAVVGVQQPRNDGGICRAHTGTAAALGYRGTVEHHRLIYGILNWLKQQGIVVHTHRHRSEQLVAGQHYCNLLQTAVKMQGNLVCLVRFCESVGLHKTDEAGIRPDPGVDVTARRAAERYPYVVAQGFKGVFDVQIPAVRPEAHTPAGIAPSQAFNALADRCGHLTGQTVEIPALAVIRKAVNHNRRFGDVMKFHMLPDSLRNLCILKNLTTGAQNGII